MTQQVKSIANPTQCSELSLRNPQKVEQEKQLMKAVIWSPHPRLHTYLPCTHTMFSKSLFKKKTKTMNSNKCLLNVSDVLIYQIAG